MKESMTEEATTRRTRPEGAATVFSKAIRS
jgi:hypothetical protein